MFEIQMTMMEGSYVALLFVLSIAGICVIANLVHKISGKSIWED